MSKQPESLRIADDLESLVFFNGHSKSRDIATAEIRRLHAANVELVEALKSARRAIGDHLAPEYCYSTGPLTGNEYADLVECPACSFLSLYEEVITKHGSKS